MSFVKDVSRLVVDTVAKPYAKTVQRYTNVLEI